MLFVGAHVSVPPSRDQTRPVRNWYLNECADAADSVVELESAMRIAANHLDTLALFSSDSASLSGPESGGGCFMVRFFASCGRL